MKGWHLNICTCFRRVSLLFVLPAYLAFSVPAAQADYEPLSSGRTKLVLDSSFVKALKDAGISIAVKAPAKLQKSVITFPVVGEKLDPTNGRGVVQHDGVLIFRAGRNSIPLKGLQLKTSRMSSPLAAKVGGSQLKLVTAQDLKVNRAGFGVRIDTSRLTISAKLATRLAKKLDAREVLKPGVALGRTSTTALPSTISLAHRNKVELSLDPGFQAKLNSLFVAVNPVFPAEHPGPFTLPIFGGTLAPDATEGRIETEGALEFLQLGGGQVLWHEPWLDLSAGSFMPEPELLPSPPYAGKQDRASVAALSQISASAVAKKRTVSLSGDVLLDAGTAAIFNQMFAKPQGRDDVFVGGEMVGRVAVVGKGQ